LPGRASVSIPGSSTKNSSSGTINLATNELSPHHSSERRHRPLT